MINQQQRKKSMLLPFKDAGLRPIFKQWYTTEKNKNKLLNVFNVTYSVILTEKIKVLCQRVLFHNIRFPRTFLFILIQHKYKSNGLLPKKAKREQNK